MEEKEPQQITGCHDRINAKFTNSPELEQEDEHSKSIPDPTVLTEVLLCSTNNKLGDDGSVDCEVRELCLPDRRVIRTALDGNSTSDEDSDCVLVPGDATDKSELILIESTSSSPILTAAPGIPTQLQQGDEGNASSPFHVVEKCAAEGVRSDLVNRQQRESSPKIGLVDVTPDDEDVASSEKQSRRFSGNVNGDNVNVDDGREKSGLSRCAVDNLADGANVDAECSGREQEETEEIGEEGVECTCSGEREGQHQCDVGSVEGVSEGVIETKMGACPGTDGINHSDNAIIQLRGVQSETVDTKPNSKVNAVASSNDAGPHGYCPSAEVLCASGSSSSCPSSAMRRTNVVNNNKNQTPTSVRTTATQVGGGNAGFGKSELQLETPKILSKRLQQLFQSAKCDLNDDVDGVVVAGEEEVIADETQEEGERENKNPTSVVFGLETNESRGSRVEFEDNNVEETPSSSMTSSLHLVGENGDCPKANAQEGQSSKDAEQGTSRRVPPPLEHIGPNADDRGRAEEEIAVHHGAEDGLAINGMVALENNQDFESETWPDCEEVGEEIEEICTCRNYSDEEAFGYEEDELLPSKDVDLSGFTTHDLLQDDSGNGTAGSGTTSAGTATTPTLIVCGRKRKISEASNAGSSSDLPCTNSNGQLFGMDAMQSKRSRSKYSGNTLGSPKTPTTSGGLGSIPAFLRTPRSAHNMHLMPKEHLSIEMSGWLVQFQKWAEQDRVMALNHIIDLCEPAQVRHVMKVIEPQFQRDFISLLPRELALQVLSCLEPNDLLRAAQTCRNWRFLCDDNLLWKDKCKQGNIMIDAESDKPKRGRAGNMPPIASPWKAAYMRQHIIELNWRSRPIRSPKVLKGHDDHVITCLQFCGNRIVSGSDDNTLRVWSAVTGKCLRVLVGHTGGVWSSQMSSKYIISGSTDRTLKVWNAETGNCEHTLYGHTSTVRCMHLHGDQVVSGSRDATLRVWDVNRGRCLHILVGHLAAVRCVQYDGKLVVSGAYDYTVKVWNPERQECLHTLQGHTNRVYSLQFDGIHVVSGSLDTSIRVWDAETGSCKHTLMGHQSLTSGMELRDNILVSGNADSTVRIWDIVSGQCLQTLSGPNKHQSAVTCLQFNSRFVITSSDDGTVKLWDVKTGEFIRNLIALDSGGSGGVVWRIRASDTKLICAVGSRNGTEETKLMVLDFDVEGACLKCS